MTQWYQLLHAVPGDGQLYEALFLTLRGSGLHPAVAAALAHEYLAAALAVARVVVS